MQDQIGQIIDRAVKEKQFAQMHTGQRHKDRMHEGMEWAMNAGQVIS